MAHSGTFILAIVLASLVAQSYQLQCYECSEADTKRVMGKNINLPCGSFSDALLVTCSASAKVCIKVDGTLDGASASVHSCGSTEKACSDRDGTTENKVSISCYSCEGDKCNSATGIVAATSLLVVSLIAAALH